jgi:hypothetical protein
MALEGDWNKSAAGAVLTAIHLTTSNICYAVIHYTLHQRDAAAHYIPLVNLAFSAADSCTDLAFNM